MLAAMLQDLLALLDAADGARFCRIQCKGRSLVNSARSNVVIPSDYATDGFVLFLFIETGEAEHTHLYCFLGRDIRETWRKRTSQYVLNIERRTFEQALAPHLFNSGKIDDIKVAIINIDVHGEFRKVIHGYMRATLSPLSLVATGTVVCVDCVESMSIASIG